MIMKKNMKTIEIHIQNISKHSGVSGVRPFFSDKYDICKHKNYRYLSDYDKKNRFDIEKYLSTNLVLKPDDTVEVYEM